MTDTHIRSSTDYKCYLCRKKIRRQGDATTIGRPTRPKTVHTWCRARNETTTASQRGAVTPIPESVHSWLVGRSSPLRGTAGCASPSPTPASVLCGSSPHPKPLASSGSPPAGHGVASGQSLNEAGVLVQARATAPPVDSSPVPRKPARKGRSPPVQERECIRQHPFSRPPSTRPGHEMGVSVGHHHNIKSHAVESVIIKFPQGGRLGCPAWVREPGS